MANHKLISQTEAYQLIRAEGTELVKLMARAATLRDEGYGRIVTYSRKVFIPLTNLCRDKCAYCTFAKAPGDPAAKTLTPDEVLSIARAGQAAGCKEALFSLGERPEQRHHLARQQLADLGYATMVDYLAAMCRLVFDETGLIPHANPGALYYDELAALQPWNGSMGMMLETVSERLLKPGQAHFGCPDKAPARRLQTLVAAGKLQIPFTTGILIGIGETPEERVDSLLAIRDVNGPRHIQEIIIQNFRRKPDIRFRAQDEPSVLDMARTIAVARLIFGPGMSIQAPPNLTPDAYSLYLLAGSNDWGGVSPITIDHINPEAAWPKIDELRLASADAGFRLRERLAVYPRHLPLAPAPIRQQVRQWLDETGLVKIDD